LPCFTVEATALVVAVVAVTEAVVVLVMVGVLMVGRPICQHALTPNWQSLPPAAPTPNTQLPLPGGVKQPLLTVKLADRAVSRNSRWAHSCSGHGSLFVCNPRLRHPSLSLQPIPAPFGDGERSCGRP